MNKIRGEVALELDKTYILLPEWERIVAIEEATGMSSPELWEHVATRKVKAKTLETIVRLGLADPPDDLGRQIALAGVLTVLTEVAIFLQNCCSGGLTDEQLEAFASGEVEAAEDILSGTILASHAEALAGQSNSSGSPQAGHSSPPSTTASPKKTKKKSANGANS